jgi:hypothetical protein
MALLQKEGIQVPPRTSPVAPPAPVLDPKVKLEHETAMHAATIAADLDKHKASEQAKVELERIRQAAKANLQQHDHQHALALAERMKPPEAKPKKRRVSKEKDGSYVVSDE